MKKSILIFSVWTFLCVGLAFLQSCIDECNDGSINYKSVSIAGEIKRINGVELGSYETPYYMVEPYVPQTNGVRYDSFGIDIVNRIEPLAYNTEYDFFNSAYACSPAENYESLENIIVTSSETYIDIYPAGADLTDLISVRDDYQLQGISIPTYLSASELRRANLFFTFNFPPSQSKVHNLTIKYRVFDGREYEVFIPGLKINK